MKKLFQIGAIFLGLLMAQSGYAQDAAPPPPPSSGYDGAVDGHAPPDRPCGDTPAGECWCKYIRYEPCYYTTQRCVEDRVPCEKRCVRYVPKYYQVQKCRYVPQYYCETKCCQEPEYYCTTEYKCRKRWVCDRHCKYVPTYYWKHTCGDAKCTSPCPTESAAPCSTCPTR